MTRKSAASCGWSPGGRGSFSKHSSERKIIGFRPTIFRNRRSRRSAHRTSPTNEGLLLVSALSAHDFGYLAAADLAGWLERSIDNWLKLDHYRGHPYNWYDTRTLTALHPAYISTVDSGNLAACALTVRQGLLAVANEPLLRRAKLAGLGDMLALVEETIQSEVPKDL